MFCNGFCGICQNPCFRGELKRSDFTEDIVPITQETITPEIEKGASEAFDRGLEKCEERGLSVVEPVEAFEIKKGLFGKERMRKIK